MESRGLQICLAVLLALILLISAGLSGSSAGTVFCQNGGNPCYLVGPFHITEWSERNPVVNEQFRNASLRYIVFAGELVLCLISVILVVWRSIAYSTEGVARVFEIIISAVAAIGCAIVAILEIWFASGDAIRYYDGARVSLFATAWAAAAALLGVSTALWAMDAGLSASKS